MLVSCLNKKENTNSGTEWVSYSPSYKNHVNQSLTTLTKNTMQVRENPLV